MYILHVYIYFDEFWFGQHSEERVASKVSLKIDNYNAFLLIWFMS